MDPIPEEPVSPELVLVDPVLRERLLRESLQDTLLAGVDATTVEHPPPARTSELTTPADVPTIAVAPRLSPERRRRSHSSTLAAAALVALFLAIPSLAFLPPRQAPELAQEPGLTLPGTEATVAWQPDTGADYYVFELSLNGRLVWLETVVAPSVKLGFAVPPGRYRWRVLSGEGRLADHDTRGPIAGGTVALG